MDQFDQFDQFFSYSEKEKIYFFSGIKNKESIKLDINIFIISINQPKYRKIFLFYIFKYKEKSGLSGLSGLSGPETNIINQWRFDK